MSRNLGAIIGFVLSAGCIPAFAFGQAPNFSVLRGDSLRIELPATQSVFVLGVSWYGDVMELYPALSSNSILPAGRQTIRLNYYGPWLRGGAPQTWPVTTQGETAHCTGGLIQDLRETANGRRENRYCTSLPAVREATQSWPELRHVVVVVTEPDSTLVPAGSWLVGMKTPNRSAAVASAVAAQLNRVDSSRIWWARGRAIKRATEGPFLRGWSQF